MDINKFPVLVLAQEYHSRNELLGHLAVLDDRTMENETRYRSVLEIFAARAAAEMERQQAEEALRISEAKFATAFSASPDAIAKGGSFRDRFEYP